MDLKRKKYVPQGKLRKPGNFNPDRDFLRAEINSYQLSGHCVKKLAIQEIRETNPAKPKSKTGLVYWGIYVN